MGNIKVIFLDMDETLLDENHRISEYTKNKLIKFQENGGRVILISGRNLSGILEYAKELKLDKYDGYFGCFNGAVVYKFLNGKLRVDFKNILNSDKLLEVNKFVKENNLSMMLYNGKKIIIENNNEYSVYENMLRDVVIYSKYDITDDIKKMKISKAVILANPKNSKEYVTMLNNKIPDFEFYLSRDCYIECTNFGINKGNFFEYMLKKLKVDNKNTICFGDSDNDYKMLEKSVNSVAMINGKRRVKDVAKYITNFDNTSDGVIKFLEKYNIV